MWTCVLLCVTDTLNYDVIAVSAAAKQTPLAIQMPDIKACVQDKIIPALRQAPQHDGQLGTATTVAVSARNQTSVAQSVD
jgi:tRNA A37 threonylcarbamoyladenosine dehydratase